MNPAVIPVRNERVLPFQALFELYKSEIRTTKYETNSKFKFFNVQNGYEEASYTRAMLTQGFWSLGFWSFGIVSNFGFRYSYFKFTIADYFSGPF